MLYSTLQRREAGAGSFGRRVLHVLALVLVTLGAAGGAGDARAQAGWPVVETPDKAVTVEMPATPGYNLKQSKSGGGTPYPHHFYTLDKGSFAYIFQVAVYPQDVDLSKPRVSLQAALDGSSRGLATGKWDTVNWVQYQGAPAVEAAGKMKDGGLSIRLRYVLKGRQMASIAFVGTAGQLAEPDTERFFKSLSLK